MTNNNSKEALSRRQAIAKLAKLSVYTAPTVTALLVAQESWALGSCNGNMTNFPHNTNNKNVSMNGMALDMDADRDLATDMGGKNNDTILDCSIA